ncbi:MAG: S-adenosylmethionine decarboxylase [Bdellovibrionales bacterium]|nr:S-adenosylmethionine decarboxylase [Bdellovibrionales bacterium]
MDYYKGRRQPTDSPSEEKWDLVKTVKEPKPDDYRGWPHLMCSGFDCDKKALMSYDRIYKFLKNLPSQIGMQPMGLPIVYKVSSEDHPDIGITGTAIIATSHISIHTFPRGQRDGKRKPRGIERRIFKPFFTFDCYSCKAFDPDIVYDRLRLAFKPKTIETALVYRLREDEELIEVEDY